MIKTASLLKLILPLLLFVISGCSFNEANNKPLFLVDVHAPTEVKINEPIAVEAFLRNKGTCTIQLEHGVNMFTYTLLDEKGKAIDHGTENSIVEGIGISTSIKSGDSYSYDGGECVSSPQNVLELKTPGTYTLVARAKFRAQIDGQWQDIELTSAPASLTAK
ncbi:hypothetical protein KQI74_06020 [Paenibacillus barcinonensis]|uniref:hypothetical protein n=1 Tax=Paenibacillus barcinonensis TaxID=198119 RepID=UPI001C113780|nr:hypothetical protein [Paenibacillus barcinonensis]MBU5351827.1 hypothetical protein [Paenibacillus barcinonensis]